MSGCRATRQSSRAADGAWSTGTVEVGNGARAKDGCRAEQLFAPDAVQRHFHPQGLRVVQVRAAPVKSGVRPLSFLESLMKRTILLACAALLSLSFVQHKSQNLELPAGAVIIETQLLISKNQRDRALVLWMLKPTKGFEHEPDEPYTCPAQTRGDNYSGQTRVSLVDTDKNKIINTVEIRPEDEEGVKAEDTFDIPYRMRKGYFYHVEGKAEGKPTIMHLKDYNGDSDASEFALFDALACMPIVTTLIGYSESKDKVVQYPVEMTIERDDEKPKNEVWLWTPYLFSEKPISPGYWKYEVDFRGRGGSLAKYEVRYNPQTEKFVGKLVATAKGGENSPYFSSPKRGV